MSRPLWKVSVTTTPEAEEAVAELLGKVFKQRTSSYTNARSRRTTVAVYLEKKRSLRDPKATLLRQRLERMRPYLNIGSGKVLIQRIPPQNWANSWKRHFKPLEIRSALLIRPSWSRRRPRKQQALVEIDPGLSFGTGQHPTTAFCLRQLVAHRDSSIRQSFLDLGAGSGILSIAAAKLGYAPIHAVDHDSVALAVARANAAANRVVSAIRFRRQDVARLPLESVPQYDVICANLIADLLLTQRKRILARLRPEGILVLAGILNLEFSTVQKAYETAGLELISGRTEKEWRSGAFRWHENRCKERQI